MRRGELTREDLSRGLETIERNARVQTRLIEDLLDMSRIVSGKLHLDIQPVQPVLLIDAAIETVMPAASAKGIRIEKFLDPHAGSISGDANRLQQVVWNLLSNAIKFTPAAGRVRISLQRVNQHLELSVADTGQGIAADFLPRVFDRFLQADSTTTRRYGGLGLGLAIVRQLVELHGGTVSVMSGGENQGTTFTVRLPLAVDSTHRHGSRPPERRASGGTRADWRSPRLDGVKVLVVDDEPDAREFLKRMLEDGDAHVVTAASAADGLKAIEAQRPDVLVSDIGMAEVDGYEFLRRVRALDAAQGGKTPAVALTAFARSEDRTKALLAGYVAHIVKPADPAELMATIAAVAGRTAE
jgi:CheY-like chemotaxis protein